MTDMCKSDPSCTLCLAAVSHNFGFVQCQNFHSASFSSVWPTGEELIFIPSIRKKTFTLCIPILCFTKTFICVAAAFSFEFNGAFVVVIQTGKGDFTPLRYFVAKRKLKMQVFLFAVLSCCKKLVLKLKWGPHYVSPPWEFTIIRRDVAKKPIFTTTWIFTFH